MRRFNIASHRNPISRIETFGTTKKSSIRSVQDFQSLRKSRWYDYSPIYCSLRICLTVVMGALLVIILWRRHGSQIKKLEKQSLVFPVYASSLNVTWRDDVPYDHPSRRSLMAQNSEVSNYISEVRPVLKHIVYRIEVEVKGKIFLMALDTGSWASWLFCNYNSHSHTQRVEDIFYTPAPENFVTPKRYEKELAESMGDFSNRYVPFQECGPGLQHMCFELSFHTWGRLAAALVEDGISIATKSSAKDKGAPLTLKFGCAFSVSEMIVPATYGLFGLGNMSISIPNQMAEKGLIKHIVGFCFQYGVYQIDHDRLHANLDPVGYFILGQPNDYDYGYQWIPMGAKPPENRHDIIYFHSFQMGYSVYNITKHGMTNGATVIDTGSAYMFLIPRLYHSVLAIVSACARQYGYIRDRTYGSHTHIWRSPPLDSYFSIYNHFKELRMIFYTEERGRIKVKTKKDDEQSDEIKEDYKSDHEKRDNEKQIALELLEEYVFRISPFGYLQIIDVLDLPFENRILHQYVIALAIYKERSVDDEMALNLIGGIALRGNKLIIDHSKQRIGLRPEYKCSM